MAVDKSKYVVLDIETNGLLITNDILSISILKPDDGQIFNKYLPLEINPFLSPEATKVNGITEKDLLGATALTQQDIDRIIEDFELDKRQVLTYGSFDERMLKHYFRRKGLLGFERICFYNFKKDIISSKWSEGNVTKDNLCNIYGISNITEVHSSLNDCFLEWQLFEKMNNNKLFVTGNKVFEMKKDYIIPISYFNSHPNLKRFVLNFPNIKGELVLLKRFDLQGEGINRFNSNINGIIIEHLINTMLNAKKLDSRSFLLENKKKLRYLGELPSQTYEIPVILKENGTVLQINQNDKKIVDEINDSTLRLKPRMASVVEFIAQEIFNGDEIKSQELVIHKEDNILALCDLSSKDSILEIKTDYFPMSDNHINQVYYEANGRRAFLLQVNWNDLPKTLGIEIFEVKFALTDNPKQGRRALSKEVIEKRINNENIQIDCYINRNEKLILKCKICEHTWELSYEKAIKNSECPFCNPKKRKNQKEKISEEEKRKLKAANYSSKIIQKSDGKVYAKGYIGAKNNVVGVCRECGHSWNIRADHLLDRTYCPKCKANKTNIDKSS